MDRHTILDPGRIPVHPLSRKSRYRSHQNTREETHAQEQQPKHQKQQHKRIVMNPPQQFIAAAAEQLASSSPSSSSPSSASASDSHLVDANGSGALMIAQNGQAVMQPQSQAQSGSQSQSQGSTTVNANAEAAAQNTQSSVGQVELQGSAVILEDSAPTTSATSATAATDSVDTSTANATSTVTTDSVTISTTAITSSSVITAASATAATTASSITSKTSTTETIPSATSTGTSASSTALATSTTVASGAASSSILTITSAATSDASSATISASTSAAALPSSSTSTHHAPSAGIIFVIILACLAVFAIVASSLSFLLRSRRLGRRFRLPCMGQDEDDDDGLSDIIRSFSSPPSRHGSIRSQHPQMGEYGSACSYGAASTATATDFGAAGVGLGLGLGSAHMASMHPHDAYAQADAALQRRSSLFANDPGASPFLHSASMAGIGSHGGFSLPLPPPLAHNASISSATTYPLPYPRGGAPSIAGSSLPNHLMGETGPLEVRNGMPDEVEGDEGIEGLHEIGLNSASPRFLGLDGNGLETPWSHTLPPRPDEIDNPTTRSFSNSHLSLPPGMVAHNSSQPPYGAFASPAPSVHEDIPQQSATWASNLRSTLFAAISAVKTPAGAGGNEDGDDRFTRAAGMVYRASTRRRNGKNNGGGGGGGEVDIEKAQDGGFPIVVEEEDDGAALGSIFLSRLESTSSEDTLTPPPRSASDRYKHYYARSKSSLSLNASAMSESGEESGMESVAEIRRPPVLAGGARAKGARTGSFIVA